MTRVTLLLVVLLSCWLRLSTSSDNSFNQTLLLTFNTSNPALRLTSQLALDNQHRRLLVADLGNRRLASFSTDPPYSISIMGGPDNFSYVSGVAIGTDGTIWVSDGRPSLLQLDAAGTTTLRNLTGQKLSMSTICALAIDSNSGSIFATDEIQGRVIKIDSNRGGVLQVYNSPTNNTWQPWGIAIYAGYLYVGDCFSSTVMKLAPNSGALLQQYDVQGALPYKSYPTGVAFDSVGNMYVADSYRVWKLEPSSGALLAMWNGTTTNIRITSFKPESVALDSARLYVSVGDRVLLLDNLNSPTPANAALSCTKPALAALFFVLAVRFIQALF